VERGAELRHSSPRCQRSFHHRWRIRCAGETKARQEQRSEVIEKLLNEANKQPEKSDEAPAKEIIPAK
jgi:hypothetical protein